MMRLGDTSFWLDTAPGGGGWVILKKSTRKRARTEVVGSYTSPRHAVQCKPKMPGEAMDALKELADAMEAGEDLLREVPDTPTA